MLFNEPKLLKLNATATPNSIRKSFSALQRAEIAEIHCRHAVERRQNGFSALQRAEIAEIEQTRISGEAYVGVSVLFNEPKLLKSEENLRQHWRRGKRFSALQRAEIAEIYPHRLDLALVRRFSALQRAEIAEILMLCKVAQSLCRFSALQRAEIAEMLLTVLTNTRSECFSALQRAEIAEMVEYARALPTSPRFQCSSTSRNC